MKKIVLGLVLTSISGFLQASDAEFAKLTSAFAEVGLKVNSVADSAVPGLQQVLTDRGLFFTANQGQFLIEGNIYDLQNKQLLNDAILRDVRKTGIAAMQDSVIEYKAKNQKHVVTVFTDTSCGYCRKLHMEMQSYLDQGITVRYLAFPRGGLVGDTYRDLQSIWCAKNKHLAMDKAKAGDKISVAQCTNTIAQQYEMGQSFGISGTPAIILADGRIIPGYQPAAALAATLNGQGQ